MTPPNCNARKQMSSIQTQQSRAVSWCQRDTDASILGVQCLMKLRIHKHVSINQFTFLVYRTHQGSQQTISGKTTYTTCTNISFTRQSGEMESAVRKSKSYMYGLYSGRGVNGECRPAVKSMRNACETREARRHAWNMLATAGRHFNIGPAQCIARLSAGVIS